MRREGPLAAGCDNTHSMRGFFVLLAALALPGVSGCGYHTLGSAAHLPDTVHTLAVPVFKNKTQSYHTEIAMTQAVVREFSDRTRLTITPEAGDGADATVDGTIISESVQPLTYRTETTTVTGQTTSVTSSFLVTINVNVLVTDRDHRVLYQHNNYVFHEQFETTADVTSFIEEDTPAVQRLSRDFAQALVSDILESF
jgi:outer membrane lipopolysaccharide assembly protein LptE/RlpB